MNKKAKLTKHILVSLLLTFLFLVFLLPLTSCKASPINKDDLINNLLPNVWVFLTHFISAIILIIVIFCFLWKPMKKSLGKRYDYIAEHVLDAERNKNLSAIELQKANQTKINALSEAMNITNTAKSNAKNIIEAAKSEAELKKNKILLDAKKDIENEKNIVKANAQNKIIDIACNVAGSILQKNVNKKDNDKFINEILNAVKKDLKKD